MRKVRKGLDFEIGIILEIGWQVRIKMKGARFKYQAQYRNWGGNEVQKVKEIK
jgi:hypothetical protein